MADYRSLADRKQLTRILVPPPSSPSPPSIAPLSPTHLCYATTSPLVSSLRHRYVYASCGATGGDAAPFQGLVKVDTEAGTEETWFPPPESFCGPPQFVPPTDLAPGAPEDSGHVLSLLYDGAADLSTLLVFSAADIAAGPVSSLPLPTPVPHPVAGAFTRDVWEEGEIYRRAKLGDKLEQKGNKFNEVKSDFSGLGLRLDDFDEYGF